MQHAYGSPDAPLVVVEHGDHECPYCAAAAPVLRRVVDGSDGRVQLRWRHFPLFTRHPHALTAALAVEAAAHASPELGWALHHELLTHQDALTDADLVAHAERVGVPDPASVVGEPAQRHRAVVEADYRAGGEAGVRGTPTLFVDGRLYTGRVDEDALRRELGLGR